MFGLPVLDVAIGMAFLYLLFALMCTTLNEIIAGILKRRAKMLQAGISSLLGSEELTKTLYQHPAIACLGAMKSKGTELPSYIPAQRFAQAITDHVVGKTSIKGAAAEQAIQALPPAPPNSWQLYATYR